MTEVVDAFGGHAEGYFLADKEAKMTLTALEHYVALAEQQTGKKVKCLPYCTCGWGIGIL